MRYKPTALFAGPSLQHFNTENMSWLRVYGPACQSDIYSELNHNSYERIILADGLYRSIPAPWHKEIMLCLEMGIEVIGVASLGALRAAELEYYGMKGSGRVFEYIRDNIVDDSEVAVLHMSADEKWKPLTLAHVEIYFWLEKLKQEGMIKEDIYEELRDWSKQIYFEKRTMKNLIKQAKKYLENTEEIIAKTWYSQKQRDLAELLQDLSKQEHEIKGDTAKWNLARTPYLYKQMSKDTNILSKLEAKNNQGDTLSNFYAYLIVEKPQLFQKLLLQVITEYVYIEIVRLKDLMEERDYIEKEYRLYKDGESLKMKDLFEEGIEERIRDCLKEKSRDSEEKVNRIKDEFCRVNGDFKPMSNEAESLFKNLCIMVNQLYREKTEISEKEMILTTNTRSEMEKSILGSIIDSQEINLEARRAIYCAKQMIDACSVYTHHGRLRLYNKLIAMNEYTEVKNEWKKILEEKTVNKPHAFFNEILGRKKLDEAIDGLNKIIKSIQPFPVDHIEAAQQLMFIEGHSMVVVKYCLDQ